MTEAARKYDKMATGTLAVADVVPVLKDLGISVSSEKLASDLAGMERVPGDSSRVSVNALQVCIRPPPCIK